MSKNLVSALTPEMAAAVRQCVESGECASSSEVIREALQDWKMKRSLQQTELAELRSLWQTGLDSGAGRFSNMDEMYLFRALRNWQIWNRNSYPPIVNNSG